MTTGPIRDPQRHRAPESGRAILHSGRGSQFGSKKVRRLLDNNDLVGSMGRVGAACDNAAMESFCSLLQKNVLNTRRRKTARKSASRSLGRTVLKGTA